MSVEDLWFGVPRDLISEIKVSHTEPSCKVGYTKLTLRGGLHGAHRAGEIRDKASYTEPRADVW